MSHVRPLLVVTLLLVAVATAATAADAPAENPPAEKPKESELLVFSDVFQVDGIIPSMIGPYTTRAVRVRPHAPEQELLWMTGFQMEVVDRKGLEPESYEYECHSNLAWPRNDPPGV